jgi:lysozyme family protein
MDLAMIKQEQGETLRKYMRRFFDKRATVVDVPDKEVIDLFQDGLYHRRTFEDFGRRRPRSIPHLMDMIRSWADEEDKPMPSTTPSAARPSRTRAATAAATQTKATATTTTTTTRVPTASASQTTLSRLSSALRRGTRRRTLAASRTC